MVVNNCGENVAQQFADKAIPVGSFLEFSGLITRDSKGVEEHIMRPGILAGYDDSFGGVPHVVLQERDQNDAPTGRTRSLPLSCIAARASLVTLELGTETVENPVENATTPPAFLWLGSKLVTLQTAEA